MATEIEFRRFLREHVLTGSPLLWILDDVDRFFRFEIREELFSLFRSWYNERAFDPSGPFTRLTLVLAYATEAYLFIRDLNQSPFNVGLGVELHDLQRRQVEALNERFGKPLAGAANLDRFVALLGGHPYLVQLGFQELTGKRLSLDRLEQFAPQETGPFGEHLRRLGADVDREPDLHAPLQKLLEGKPLPALSCFHRLRSLGVVIGTTELEVRLRCGLYSRYLRDRVTG